jgi:hypothetical protein
LHARDTRGATSPKEDPIMSQLYELSADTPMATDMRAANATRHTNQITPANSPTSQEVRL